MKYSYLRWLMLFSAIAFFLGIALGIYQARQKEPWRLDWLDMQLATQLELPYLLITELAGETE